MTKSAFDFSFGVPVPFNTFSRRGSARSGALFISPWIASIFRSSSLSESGRGAWPERWRTSISSALGVFLPAALREAMLQFGEGCECGVAFALAILGVSLPIKSSVGLRAVALGEFGE